MQKLTHKYPPRNVLAWLLLLAMTVIAVLVIFGNASATDKPAAVQPFDHSNCQYPNRTTNPPNGCDNSDPCDAATTKFGSGECTDTSNSQAEPTSQNVKTGDKPVETVHNSCAQ